MASPENFIFDPSFETVPVGKAPRQTWHRAGSYTLKATPWQAGQDGAFHGEKCLKTSTKGTLELQREIGVQAVGPYTFSAYLRAGRPGHRVRLWIRTYRQGRPFVTDEVDREVAVLSVWDRYSLTLDVPQLRNRGLLGPVDLGVESLEDGDVFLDAVQFERAADPSDFVCEHPKYARPGDLRSPLYPPLIDPPEPAGTSAEQSGRIRLSPARPVASLPTGWPTIGTVTLPEGQSYSGDAWSLRTEDGQDIPAQRHVLARWKKNGSIKALQVIAERSGSDAWELSYGPSERSADFPLGIESQNGDDRIELRSSDLAVEIGAASGLRIGPLSEDGTSFFTETVDGQRFDSASGGPAGLRLEEEGPARAVARIEGEHRRNGGPMLFSYVARVNLFCAVPMMRMEYTWINTNADPSTPVGAIGWHIPLGQKAEGAVFEGADGQEHAVDLTGGPASLIQLNIDGSYSYEVETDGVRRFDGKAAGLVRVNLGDQTLLLRVDSWWQNHPLGFHVDENGLTVYFWPNRVKAVDLTQGMAKTYLVDLWYGPTAGAPNIFKGPLHVIPPPEVYCASGLFGGRMLPQPGSPFPIFESMSTNETCLDHMSPSFLETNEVYGQFNFGDTFGDGGYCNLETQLGHAMWMAYIRTGNPDTFDIAQAAARHYRDIDMDQITGSTITHYPTHTLGGKSTSHAWIQGMLDHYMTTGERRSMEVAMLHCDFLKNLTPDKLTSGGRTVTRVLDNLADLFMLTGDGELIAHYRRVCDFQGENIAGDRTEFPGLFQSPHQSEEGVWIYPGNFVPWYGLYSQAKLWVATGEREWADALARETGHAFSAAPFRFDRPEYFENNPLNEDQQIVRCLAEGKIRNRGCMLFPALGYAYRATGDRRYLELGMTSVYISLISGNYENALYVLAGVFLEQAREGGMGKADEERYLQAARDIMTGMAHPTLFNPGFEEGVAGWAGWKIKATTSGYWIPIRKASIRVDREVKKEDRQSLHIVIRREMPPQGFGVPIESDDFQLEGGRKYTLSGWVKYEGDVAPHVALHVHPLVVDMESSMTSAKIGPEEAGGWRRWSMETPPGGPSIGRIHLRVDRTHQASEGDAWFDGFSVDWDHDAGNC